MLEGSQEFKERYEELLAAALAQKNKDIWERANERIKADQAAAHQINDEDMKEMEDDLNHQMERLAKIENADYTISPEAIAELK